MHDEAESIPQNLTEAILNLGWRQLLLVGWAESYVPADI